MTQEPRKATDVLLDIESAVRTLLGIVRAQDLNIKVLSNKLNDVCAKLDKQPDQKITVEAVQSTPIQRPEMHTGDPERSIVISAETTLPQENFPKGFRRTSRPETYAGDDAVLQKPQPPNRQPQRDMKPPPGRSAVPEIIVPPQQQSKKQQPAQQQKQSVPADKQQVSRGQIPVMQRCVDKNGKSIFLADVAITDVATNQQIFKTRTSGTGKWMASLAVGVYKVKVHKQGSSIKDQIDSAQEVQIDGTKSPLELPMMIIK